MPAMPLVFSVPLRRPPCWPPPAMMGLMVENRYDGVLKKQGRVLHSTKHDGQGIGLVSVETAVHRYHGNLTVETSGNVFRANVLLNL